MIRVIGLVIALTVFWASAPTVAATDNASPVAVVEGFHGTLLDAMKNADSLGVRGRYARLDKPVTESFDLANMIRIASGSFWRTAGDDDHARLLDAFRHFSVATYAAQFDGYSGQIFRTVGDTPGPQQTVLVATKIIGSDGDGADLTYVMKQRDGRWLIADVLLDNSISQLAVRRSEYRQVLKNKGIEGLLGILNTKADGLLSAQ